MHPPSTHAQACIMGRRDTHVTKDPGEVQTADATGIGGAAEGGWRDRAGLGEDTWCLQVHGWASMLFSFIHPVSGHHTSPRRLLRVEPVIE